jgi:hypothetical protein
MLKSAFASQILKAFKKIYAEYLYERSHVRKPNSKLIKYVLVNLGHSLKFRVYANGLSGTELEEQQHKYHFVNKEFLYDVHWYLDVKGLHYTPETVSLIVESELGDRRKGDKSNSNSPAVKFDFQKLLIANAQQRLLVFKVYSQQQLTHLNDYFNQAIKEYKLLPKKSSFLFICFDHSTKMLYYAEKQKK